MKFRRYQHLERLGTDETDGILIGDVYVFHKIDGTNGSVWLDDGEIKAGSRNRELTLDNDNAGFYEYVLSDDRLKKYLEKHPNHRLYGEFLVPHSLKTYRDDAWRKFYVFDVVKELGNDEIEYITYDTYKPLLDEFDLEYIPPIVKMTNPKREYMDRALEKSSFLLKEGENKGEGIVIKNYNFYNKYNRQKWGKVVSNEFKEKHTKEMGYNEFNKKSVEESIVEKYVTEAFVEKEFSKIVNEKDGWNSKYIPMLLGRVYHELVVEETWNFVKELKNPTVDFGYLRHLVIKRIKEIKSDIFS